MSIAAINTYILWIIVPLLNTIYQGAGGIVKKNLEIFVGKRIRQFRQEMGLTIEELAFKAQLHPNYLGDIERGERNPSLKNLNKIANALEKPLAAIVSNDSVMETMRGAAKIREKNSLYSTKKYPENVLSLIKSLMKNSDKDREYIIQTAKSLSKQLRKK